MPDRRAASAATLVTGAAGFAGSHVLEMLARDPAAGRLVGWHRPCGREPIPIERVEWDAVDLLDRGAVRQALDRAQPSIVYHCAGAAHVGRSWRDMTATLEMNVLSTHYLLEALRAAGCRARVLIPGSAMVYAPAGEPLTEDHPLVPRTPYGVSKLAQERLGAKASAEPIAVLIGRAFNHIGPRQDPSFAASGFARQIAEIEAGRRGPEVVVGNLEARRDTMDVRDTVRAYRLIVENGEPARAYNIATGRASSIGEMLSMLTARARVPVRVRVDPARFRPQDLPLLVGDSSRLRTELGWQPTIPLEQTLDDLLAYWRGVIGSGH